MALYIKQTFKKILKSQFIQNIICYLIFLYGKLTFHSCKWKGHGVENIQHLLDEDKPIIFVVWHNRILLSPFFLPKPKERASAVVSIHKDGEIVSKYIQLIGIKLIRGSSSKGAMAAFKQCIRTLKSGDDLVITPDGPRGPRMHLGGNVITIAKIASAPIVPFTCSTRKCKVFNTWDSFILPLPFSRGIYAFGEPIYIDKTSTEEEIENLRIELEKKLRDLSIRIDKETGLEPIRPA